MDHLEVLRAAKEKWEPRGQNTRELQYVTVDQVKNHIGNLSNSKSTGHDNIDGTILKLAKHQLATPLTWIINMSIKTRKFPRIWKIAKIMPLFKNKGSRLDRKNYRPVSLLSPASKILECCILEQIEDHMSSNKHWHPGQNAYRPGRNTTTALLQLGDMWLHCIEEKMKTVLMLINLSAAFDCIEVNILTKKNETL